MKGRAVVSRTATTAPFQCGFRCGFQCKVRAGFSAGFKEPTPKRNCGGESRQPAESEAQTKQLNQDSESDQFIRMMRLMRKSGPRHNGQQQRPGGTDETRSTIRDKNKSAHSQNSRTRRTTVSKDDPRCLPDPPDRSYLRCMVPHLGQPVRCTS